MKAIPWTYDERPDTRTTNVRLGVWLFLASESMFFGSLFSAYVLLRSGAESWPDAGSILDGRLALLNTVLLLGSTAIVVVLAGAGKRSARGIDASASFRPGMLVFSAGLAVLFLFVKGWLMERLRAAKLYCSSWMLYGSPS